VVYGVDLSKCKSQACTSETCNVINYLNQVCELRRCDSLKVLRLSSAVGGWNIYVFNASTFAATTTGVPSEEYESIDQFPVWAIAVIIVVLLAIIIGVIVGVIFYRRRNNIQNATPPATEGPDHPKPTQAEYSPEYENTEVNLTRKDSVIYSEIPDPVKFGNVVHYKKQEFHGDKSYDGLGPRDESVPAQYESIQ
jgi:hypothetical protein